MLREIGYVMCVAKKTVAPPETIDTTASVSSLVVRSMSGICDVNIRLSNCVFKTTDIIFMRPWRSLEFRV